jgi:hypothetical protein
MAISLHLQKKVPKFIDVSSPPKIKICKVHKQEKENTEIDNLQFCHSPQIIMKLNRGVGIAVTYGKGAVVGMEIGRESAFFCLFFFLLNQTLNNSL